MKKPNSDLFLRQFRIARTRKKERCKRRHKTRPLNGTRFLFPAERIQAPLEFDLTRGSGISVIKFLRAIAARVLGQEKHITLDFRKTKIFYPAATILLFAEIDRIITQSSLLKPITLVDPWMRRSREVLKQIGLHRLTGDRCDVIPERKDVLFWKATKGSNQSGDQLAMLGAVADRVNQEHKNQLEVSGLWRGVSEAVANSVDHAYKHPRDDGFKGLLETKWWMFTHLRDAVFTMAVCDLGCGYQSTVRETFPERFLALLKTKLQAANRDAIAIETAMEYGRSGTQEGHRGKGSRDALSVLKKHGGGELLIASNTGWLRYVFKNNDEYDQSSGDLGINIRGTIVWWKLKLQPVKENVHVKG